MVKTTKKTQSTRKPVYESPKNFDGANWNAMEDAYTQFFYEQNLSQFWRPEDISLQLDLNIWQVLPEEVKLAYAQNLLVLTFLDTYQGDMRDCF